MILLGNSLQTFLHVVEEGSVHGAAHKLHLTQTAVTQRIKNLESELQVSLFTRSRQGMQLTYEGHALLKYCKAACDLEGEFLPEVLGRKESYRAKIKVMGPTSMIKVRVLPVIKKITEKFKDMTFVVHVNDNNNEIRRFLKKGEIDIALLPKDHVTLEMDSKIIKNERYILVCSSGWKGRKLKDIITHEKIIDFDFSDEITSLYLRKFSLDQYAKKERHLINRTELLIDLVKKQVGYTTVNPEVIKEELSMGELIKLNKGNTLEVAHALAWYPRKNMPSYLEHFIKNIK